MKANIKTRRQDFNPATGDFGSEMFEVKEGLNAEMVLQIKGMVDSVRYSMEMGPQGKES